jgi:hypothetical protein
MITVQTVVTGLIQLGYTDIGGSEVFRILRGMNGQCIKVYYNDYESCDYIIVRESVEDYADKFCYIN